MNHSKILRLKTILITTLAVFSLTACRDNEALAEFDGGKVTRKDFRTLLASFRGEGFIKQTSVEMQEQILQNLAITQIVASEAKKNKLDRDAEFEKKKSLFKEETMVPAYIHRLREKFKDEPFEMINMQFLFLVNKGDRKMESQSLLTELNDTGKSDSDIEDIISLKSENLRYKNAGGYIDPFCISCSFNPVPHLTTPLQKAPERKFITVEDTSGTWIIRKISQKKIKPDELKYEFEKFYRKVFDFQKRKIAKLDENSPERKEIEQSLMTKESIISQSEQSANAQIEREMNTPIVKTIEEMKAKKNFTIHTLSPNEMQKGLPDTFILYSYKDVHYTYGELKNKLKDIYGDDFRQHLNVLNGTIIPYELLKDEKDFQGIVNDPFYTFISDLQTNNILASIYIMRQINGINISDEEINQWFELRKNTEYKGKFLPMVRNDIKQNIQKLKQQEIVQKLQMDLSKKYNLKINREKLTAGKI